MVETAYVITWRHSDGSGSGATAVFMDRARAEVMLKILAENSFVTHKTEAVPFDSAAGVPPIDGGQQ
jgi:hypothetical protein